jgi:prepilin-type N-terminal cleavage/methylation domain-containing protein
MRKDDRGFTIIEMMVVVMIGAILATIAMQSFQGVQGRAAARAARNTFVSLHARTRANAIERGQIVKLNIDKDGDSVWITRGTTQVEAVRMGGEDFGVDIQGSGTLTLCMTPRGYAEINCNNFTSTQTLVFEAGGDTARIDMQTMGQLK